MGSVSQPRYVACKLLGEVRRREARARDVLRESPAVSGIDARERGLVVRLVLGVVGAQGLLDECIDCHLNRRVKLEPVARDVMRLSAYELLFLNTPSAVAVSQGVELMRRMKPRATGLANAILRKVAKTGLVARTEAYERVLREDGDDVRDLALVSGYPTWLLRRVPHAREMALSAIEPAPVYVGTNQARHDCEHAEALLFEAGLDPHACDVSGSFVLGSPAGLHSSGLVGNVDVVPADLSAQRVASRIPLSPHMRMLEVGQGRGTKTILIESEALRRVGGPISLTSVDSVGYKTRVARKRVERAGFDGVVECLEYDGCKLSCPELPEPLRGNFDTVFVDAPCSGTGTLRRHPEICWSLTPRDVGALAELQKRLLRSAATRVSEGGVLCYATCSVLREENEDVVSNFLGTDLGSRFELESEPMQTLPVLGGADGHFLALLRHR